MELHYSSLCEVGLSVLIFPSYFQTLKLNKKNLLWSLFEHLPFPSIHHLLRDSHIKFSHQALDFSFLPPLTSTAVTEILTHIILFLTAILTHCKFFRIKAISSSLYPRTLHDIKPRIETQVTIE